MDIRRASEKNKTVGTGLPVSPGRAQGRVTILTSISSEPANEGQVVVTKHLKPFFAPFILKAAALITEEGGEFCHAAIIAREIGVPCIILPNATKLLNEDQCVIVDAGTGAILDARCE